MDYGYDAEGRLLKHYEARQGHSRAQFSYDAADNLAASDDAVPVTDNRLQHWQALFMKYDHWGNLVSRRNGLYEQHYVYDAENRLVSARGTGPEGRFEARYHYDALGRRTRKIVTTAHGTSDTRFLWQGYRLLQEQQNAGQCSTYIYDPNEAWSPLARVDHLRDQSSGEIYWFNTDLNGAPLEVTDEHGAVRWSGQYGSFGEVRHQSEGFSRVVNRTAMAHQPLRYAGQYADGETGLHYNLFRYYDPQVGRFIVQDPIGLNGGWNLYQYAPNPLGWIDPWGLAGVRLPRNNGHWDGIPGESNWYSYNDKVNAVTSNQPIPFSDGRPDFSAWSKGTLTFEDGVLNGTDKDFSKVYSAIAEKKGITQKAAQNLLREKMLTPHHLSANTIILVPRDLHGNVPHIGSASDMRRKGKC